MKKKKYRYKILIGLIVGVVISLTGVYATTSFVSNAVDLGYYSNNWLNSTNVQDALDKLYKQKGCPFGYVCLNKKNTLALGDFVSYTPTKTSYTTDTTKTGYTSTQTINPSELNLWRVLSINQDGTVDLISEYVSSVDVYFRGLDSIKNFVGYLNTLASQYENSTYTIGSRYFGYNGQTEYITSDTYFVNPAPWTCKTGQTCTPDPDDYEAYGGGDTLYTNDYNLVNTVLGTRVANKVGTSTPTAYWMASRYYYYDSATFYGWCARCVTSSGSINNYFHYSYRSSSFSPGGYSYALRPIVTLKTGLSYSGVGTKEYPMEIVG